MRYRYLIVNVADTNGLVSRNIRYFAQNAEAHIGIRNERGEAVYKKGYHHTEEEKAKIRASKLGDKNPNFGRKLTQETRDKMSKSRSGEKHWSYGKSVNQERKDRQIQSLKDYYSSEQGEELKKKLSSLIQGNSMHLGYKHEFSDEFKAKRSVFMKEVWGRSIDYKNNRVRKILKGSAQRPTKPEITIMGILGEIDNFGWAYIGDGDEEIGGKNPDFKSLRENKLIEHYGIHWHENDNPKDRIDYFRKYGYETLIIWEDELKSPELVKTKIAQFVNQ